MTTTPLTKKLSPPSFRRSLLSLATHAKGYLNPSDAAIITAADRKELVDWCYGIVDHYHLPREIVTTAMEMVDRFLSISAGPFALWNVNSDVAKVGRNVLHCKSKFQLLTVAALSNCTFKLKDEIMTSDEFAEAYGSLYTPKEIEVMTYALLRGLSWRPNITAIQVGHAILSLLRHNRAEIISGGESGKRRG